MARKFLYIVAGIIVLVLAGLFALRFWAADLTRLAMVPRAEFSAQPPLAATIYADPAMWFSHPGLGKTDAAHWLPKGFAGEDAQGIKVAVFFIHPTSYLANKAWNAPLDDAESQGRARLFVRGMASPFNSVEQLWVPRYRQAAFGAFLTNAPAGHQALDLAQADLTQAFDHFVQSTPAGTPIIIAGHSQGGLMTMRLLRDRVAGTPLAQRVLAAYVVGWPVSPARDLPEMGLQACAAPAQTGCVVSWSSWGEPAEPLVIEPGVPGDLALDGKPRGDGPVLCTNPLTGTVGGTAPASANHGTMVPSDDLTSGELKPGMVPARCDAQGLLMIGPPPKLGPYVLPGNNYHVYDIPLFWQNLREDFRRRALAWKPQ